jgi:hypothetical protein
MVLLQQMIRSLSLVLSESVTRSILMVLSLSMTRSTLLVHLNERDSFSIYGPLWSCDSLLTKLVLSNLLVTGGPLPVPAPQVRE